MERYEQALEKMKGVDVDKLSNERKLVSRVEREVRGWRGRKDGGSLQRIVLRLQPFLRRTYTALQSNASKTLREKAPVALR